MFGRKIYLFVRGFSFIDQNRLLATGGYVIKVRTVLSDKCKRAVYASLETAERNTTN